MAIKRDEPGWIITCTRCGEELFIEDGDFYDALAEMRDEGWIATKHGQEWSHYCGDCQD